LGVLNNASYMWRFNCRDDPGLESIQLQHASSAYNKENFAKRAKKG
jgi:hypothetical protein